MKWNCQWPLMEFCWLWRVFSHLNRNPTRWIVCFIQCFCGMYSEATNWKIIIYKRKAGYWKQCYFPGKEKVYLKWFTFLWLSFAWSVEVSLLDWRLQQKHTATTRVQGKRRNVSEPLQLIFTVMLMHKHWYFWKLPTMPIHNVAQAWNRPTCSKMFLLQEKVFFCWKPSSFFRQIRFVGLIRSAIVWPSFDFYDLVWHLQTERGQQPLFEA